MSTSAAGAAAPKWLYFQDYLNRAVAGAKSDWIDCRAESPSASVVGNIISTGDGDDRIAANAVGLESAFNDVRAGRGHDSIRAITRAADVNTIIRAGAGNDRVDATSMGEGDCLVRGGLGNDTIRASGDQVRLFGGAGNDTLRALTAAEFSGDAGSDRLIASPDEDVFHFNTTYSPVYSEDRITGFDSAEDHIAFNVLTDGMILGVTDNGQDVRVQMWNNTDIVFEGMGTGEIDSIYQLVDDPDQISGWPEL